MIHPKKRVCRPAGRDDERPITNSSRSLLIAVSSIDRLSLVKGKKVEAPSKKGEALELVQLDLQKTSIAFVHPTESEAPFVFGTNTAVKPLRSPSAQAYRPNPLQSRVPPEIIDEIAIKLDLISFTHFAQTCARVRQACFGLQPVKTIISQMLQDWPTFLTPQEEKALSTLARRHTLVVPDSFREMIIEGPRTFIVDWLELPIFTDSEWKQIFISRFSAAAYQRAIAIKTVPWRTLYTRFASISYPSIRLSDSMNRELSALEQLYAYGAGPRLNTSMTLPILFNEPEWCRNPVTMLWLNRDGTVEAQGNTHLNHANHVTPEELMQIERIAYHAGRRTFGPDSLVGPLLRWAFGSLTEHMCFRRLDAVRT